jgi:hypothetical protein
MMATPERKTIERKSIPLPKPRASQSGKLPRKFSIPVKIISNCHVVWLGAYSKDTIPIFARDLLKQITFIDTAVDCIEHITSLVTSQRHIILIMSDEYATDRKVIAHMLNLNEIEMIYIILDSCQQETLDWFFNDTRIALIFNDTFTVLKQFLPEKVEKSTHFHEQVRNVQGVAKKDLKNVEVLVSADKSQKPVRIEQTSPPHIQTEISVRKERTTTAKKVEEPASPLKGFVTVTNITQSFT